MLGLASQSNLSVIHRFQWKKKISVYIWEYNNQSNFIAPVSILAAYNHIIKAYNENIIKTHSKNTFTMQVLPSQHILDRNAGEFLRLLVCTNSLHNTTSHSPFPLEESSLFKQQCLQKMHVNVWIQQIRDMKDLQKNFPLLALLSELEDSMRKASSAAFVLLQPLLEKLHEVGVALTLFFPVV